MRSVELSIEALAAGGEGVGRGPDGRVVFVPFTAPGDRVRVRIERERKRWSRGRVERLLEAGDSREEPACAVFGSCGGCAWQHLAYSAQVAAKARILEDALARIGGLECPGPVSVRPSPSPYGYRARTRVLVQGGRVGYRRRRSHALCVTARCPVLVPSLQSELRELAASSPGEDGEWELAAGEGAARAVALDGRREAERVELSVAGERIGVSPGVFAQSNALLLDPLAGAVHEAAGRGRCALELFAGAGFLTLGLARRFERVVALESSVPALRDLRWNLRRAGLWNAEVLGSRVEAALAADELAALRPDAVVLDPPRSGLPADCAGPLAGLGAERIAYLACDPATLARDLALLVREGYRLRRVEGFDLFPQTPHVEALALLERDPARIG